MENSIIQFIVLIKNREELTYFYDIYAQAQKSRCLFPFPVAYFFFLEFLAFSVFDPVLSLETYRLIWCKILI